MTAQPIVDALDAALEAAGVAFGDGRKPQDATTRYVVAWFDDGLVTDRSLRSRDGLTVTAVFHAYGQTPQASRFADAALRAAVLGLHRQELGGRTVHMPENLSSMPLQRDDDLDPPLFDVISEWRFRTTPA